MIYGVHADTKLMVAGWPQFFKTVFHLSAKNIYEAEMIAKRELDAAAITYNKFSIEYLGKEYRVSSNEATSVAGVKYAENSITGVAIFEGTMQILIDCKRNGREDHDNIGIWCRPSDFKSAVENLFSKIKCDEI